MPYVSPKDLLARPSVQTAQQDLGAAPHPMDELASSLSALTTAPPSQPEPAPAASALEDLPSMSSSVMSPEPAPSLSSCATQSSSSIHTMSSTVSEADAAALVSEADPSALAQYHHSIYAWTKPLYDAARARQKAPRKLSSPSVLA